MGLYADRILPALVDLSIRNKLLRPYRERVTAAAEVWQDRLTPLWRWMAGLSSQSKD